MEINDRMLKIGEVLELAGLSKPSVYRRMKDSNFPQPKAMGPRAVGWSETEVRQWLSDRPTKEGS